MPDQFTEDEIKTLVAAGKITWGDLGKIPKGPTQDMAIRAVMEKEVGAIPLITPSPLGASGPVISGLGGLVKESAKVLVPTIAQGAASAAGHPWIGMTLAHGLGRAMGRPWGGMGKAPTEPTSPPAQFSGTSMQPAKVTPGGPGFSTGPTTTGPKAAPPAGPPIAPKLPEFAPQRFPLAKPGAPHLPRFGGEEPPNPPNVEKTDPRPSKYSGMRDRQALPEIHERVTQGGVQHDFKGRVSFERGSPRSEFPLGANNKTLPAEFKRLLEEAAERNYADADPQVQAIREFIQTRLRKPK